MTALCYYYYYYYYYCHHHHHRRRHLNGMNHINNIWTINVHVTVNTPLLHRKDKPVSSVCAVCLYSELYGALLSAKCKCFVNAESISRVVRMVGKHWHYFWNVCAHTSVLLPQLCLYSDRLRPARSKVRFLAGGERIPCKTSRPAVGPTCGGCGRAWRSILLGG